MSRISIKAVLLGFGATLLLDVLVGAALLAILGDVFVEGNLENQTTEAVQATGPGLVFLWSSVVLGSVTTAVGGYVVARVARSYPYFNALALGLLGAVFGLLFWPQYPLWFNLLGLLLVVPATLLGAHLRTVAVRTHA